MSKAFSVDDLAQEIRRVDGAHSLGAGALAEALMPFLAALQSPIEPVGWRDFVSEALGCADIEVSYDSVGRQYTHIKNSDEIAETIVRRLAPGSMGGGFNALPQPSASSVPTEREVRLVLAAREVAFNHPSPEAIQELDQASEAYAADVPWDDDPNEQFSDLSEEAAISDDTQPGMEPEGRSAPTRKAEGETE